MSEPKFTKGPWCIEPGIAEDDGTAYIGTDNWGGLATAVTLFDNDPNNPLTAQGQANAHLIAAAPELYAALSNMLIWASTISSLYPGHKRDGGTVEGDLAAAEQALKKARGEA